MPKFKVTRKWDAFDVYAKDVEADTAEGALEIAKNDDSGWEHEGVQIFCYHLYDVEDEDGELKIEGEEG